MTRREGLRLAGAAALSAAVAGRAHAQDDGDPEETFELGGHTEAWNGRSPSSIDGEENPTLDLEPDLQYEVVWENQDGVPHDFTIRDADGSAMTASDVAEEQGERRSLTFTATEEMDHYVCTFHVDTMRGDVQFDGGTDGGDGELLPPDPSQLVGGALAATAGVVVGLGYAISRVFEDSHEP